MSDQRSIELFEDVDFQRRQWRWQRTGWLLMGLVTSAGLLGIFGSGPFSSSEARAADGTLTVFYERFVRRDSPSRLRAILAPPQSGSGRFELQVDRALVDGTLIQSITPEPAQVSGGTDAIIYRFDTAPATRVIAVTFELETRHAGTLQGRLRTAGGDAVTIDQLVYP